MAYDITLAANLYCSPFLIPCDHNNFYPSFPELHDGLGDTIPRRILKRNHSDKGESIEGKIPVLQTEIKVLMEFFRRKSKLCKGKNSFPLFPPTMEDLIELLFMLRILADIFIFAHNISA